MKLNFSRGVLWDKIFKKPDKPIQHNLQEILSGAYPIYSTGFGENVYASDVVQQAIYSIVTELKKLDPVHVRKSENADDYIGVSGNIQNVLDAPNPIMTTSDFIEKIAWTLLLNYNAFVYPIWEGNTLTALYPLQPSKVEFDTNYGGSGQTWVRFTFPNGYSGDIPYDDVIHLRYRYSVSEFMGGNRYGQPDFEPLLETLKLNDILLKGLAKSLNIQTAINGVVKLKTMANYEDQIAKIKEFERKLQANESGLLPIDVSADFTPIQKSMNLLDEKVLEFIDKKILRTFGVSIPIINGDFTVEQLQAFYQKVIEPIVKSMGQAFTKGLFTKHKAVGFNNQIRFLTKELIFMSTSQKIELVKELGPTGTLLENEKRVMFGMRPLKELEGVRMSSLNFINAKDASQYQVGENNNTGEGGGDNGQST